ncbi:MAG: flagellar assembly protein FliX [Pseudomonadota bacterium]
MVDKVGYTRPVTTTRSAKRTGGVSAPGFADALSRAEEAAAVDGADATGSIAALGGMGGFLGAQEVDTQDLEKRKAVKRGRLTLDALSQLRDALLMGELPLSTIHKLEQLVKQERGLATDPALKSILDDIEVRAAVEMAKLEMAGLLPPGEPAA